MQVTVCHTPHDAPEGFADKAQRCGARYTFSPVMNAACLVPDAIKDDAEFHIRRSAARALGPCQPFELIYLPANESPADALFEMSYFAWRWNP